MRFFLLAAVGLFMTSGIAAACPSMETASGPASTLADITDSKPKLPQTTVPDGQTG